MEILGSAAIMAGGKAATGSSRYSFSSSSDIGTEAQKYEKVLLSGIISARKRSANCRTLNFERSNWACIGKFDSILAHRGAGACPKPRRSAAPASFYNPFYN